MNPLWLPASQLVVSTAAEHPAGTLVWPFEAHAASAGGLALRLDGQDGQGKPTLLLFVLKPWPPYAEFGDLIDVPPGQTMVGFRSGQAQHLRLEAIADAPSLEVTRDPKGGLLIYTPAGCQLQGLRERHGHLRGTRPYAEAIDSSTWSAAPIARGLNPIGTMYQDRWRLRLHLSDREIVTVAEGGSPTPA